MVKTDLKYGKVTKGDACDTSSIIILNNQFLSKKNVYIEYRFK